MLTLVRGERIKLADISTATCLKVGLSADVPVGNTLDISCFGVDVQDKLSDDRYFIFYNQKSSPCGSIKSLGEGNGDHEQFQIDLSHLPSFIRKLVFVVTIDGRGVMSQVHNGYLRLLDSSNEVARFSFSGSDFGKEKAIIAGEIYFKDVWRFSAVGHGFNGGLSALLKHFGGDEITHSPDLHIGSPTENKQPEKKSQKMDIPVQGITIEFAESTSASFDSALKQAKSAFTFQEYKRGKKQWYCATWSKEQIFEIIKLAKELKGLRNRKIYIDGKEHSWNDVFYFVYCMESRQQAYRPDEYCFGIDDGRLNIWGCKNANMEWTNWAKWFSFGSFKSKERFVFDKKRIRHDLENNLYKIRFCPFFSPQLVETVFNLFPNEVTISDKGYWEYKRCYDEVPGTIRIKRIIDNGGFRYTDEFFSDGVSPKGIDEAITILHNAFKSLGRKQLAIKR